jgi:type 1 glutamine amidotransferase
MDRRELLKLTSGAWLGWRGSLALAASGGRSPKVLYFTRSAGFEHPVVKRQNGQLAHSEKCLIDMGKRNGFEVECIKDGGVFDAGLDGYDLIAFYTSGVLTDPGKDGGPPMTASGKQKLLDAVAQGKPFVGFHACSDSFHSKGPRNQNQAAANIDPYIAMLGGEFIKHGAQQEASLVITSRFPGASSMAMGEGIAFHEEWYSFKNFAKDLHVILTQETCMMKGPEYQRPDYPSTWARMHGRGRVFYTALGHREDMWTNPFFEAIALGGIAWALGRVAFDISPNIDQVTPEAGKLNPELKI